MSPKACVANRHTQRSHTLNSPGQEIPRRVPAPKLASLAMRSMGYPGGLARGLILAAYLGHFRAPSLVLDIPADPIAEGPSHDQVFVLTGEPG